MNKERKEIGEVLVEKGYINEEQLENALKEQSLTGEKLGEILIKNGWLTKEELDSCLALQTGISKFDLSSYIISPDVARLVPEHFARQYKLIPIFKLENTLTVAMAEPTNVFIVDELQKITGCMIEPVLADEITIHKTQDQYYGMSGSLQEIVANLTKGKIKDVESLGEEAPIIKLVNLIVVRAIEQNASDIHIEPEDKFLGVRYRIDGILYRRDSLPKYLQPAIISRIKIMARLDVAEKRLPQDGRIIMKVATNDIDFRVSTCPTVHGENAVLRILDKSTLVVDLDRVGFAPEQLKDFESLINHPYGIILVTGPTGSGKTTTLYAALKKINREDINIMTVEDPVEYQFPQIRQVHVNPKIGLTFAAALRSFLRQDPDIIMVGEIRDLETAEIAVQAALTGHLVFSTIHTNDAATAFTRLIEMGIEPFLVSSSILGIVAQRLIRKICLHCRQEHRPSEETLNNLGIDPKGKTVFYKGKGCKLCNNTGYKGRIGIFELIKNNPSIQSLVLKKASADDIKEEARKEGLESLRESAMNKLFAGVTTVEEILRVT
ncbi:MAG: ATPase, T2SS/T4P/T4SS family [Candidatus Omnitrophota bacterium]